MFSVLEEINARPRPFEFYTARELWTSDHTSAQMLKYHLDEAVDLSSRNTTFIDRSVDWMASRFDLAGGTRVIDFGCGPGLYATRLAERGALVTGVDFSKRSIDYARGVAEEKGLAIEYVNQDYLSFETAQRYALATMIMCDYCALSPAQRQTMLGTFHTVLAPGGAVLLDAYTLAAFERREEATAFGHNHLDGFWASEDYYGFQNTFKYDDEKVVLDKYTIFEPSHSWAIYNWLQYFSVDALERELEDAGFTIEQLYGDVTGAPFDPEADEFAVLARRA